MPWYSAQPSFDTLLVGREQGLFHLVCYLRDGNRVFETYWTMRRGAEVVDYSYALMDLTVFGRQEEWETRRRVGRGTGTRPGPWTGLPTGRPCPRGQADVPPRSGHGSKPGTRMIWEPPTRAQSLRLTATEASFGASSANEEANVEGLRADLLTGPSLPAGLGAQQQAHRRWPPLAAGGADRGRHRPPRESFGHKVSVTVGRRDPRGDGNALFGNRNCRVPATKVAG
jgi:hypothetical protein